MLPLTELICMSKRNWIEPRHVLGRLNSVWRALGQLYPSLAESICMGVLLIHRGHLTRYPINQPIRNFYEM
ncbi:hypothetical protein QE320_gp056 [Pseudomonas phage EM]|uniref:Uncharacterized protein n=1 Tax=Pseudomonas phage EM TaxID=2936914 RepID=A0AAE9HG18_9CAUD|nr:hypothetical protein QE320_gp056 [Pseudomonas phage EM]UPW35858.1 hypothetical protein EM_056 [Pseudomonas phage EM]